ncbi:hypothetical protein [Burkholderia sp. Bp9090]|uniref:hypothetical protein n=1 Tax=Burkholderia sp. Bp9090 TaxID=2184567 RepID=UPI000F5F1696|nr:hypothetical protein [Burkholderia sp. Bp9090]
MEAFRLVEWPARLPTTDFKRYGTRQKFGALSNGRASPLPRTPTAMSPDGATRYGGLSTRVAPPLLCHDNERIAALKAKQTI